jgi:hypothetical protein
MELCNSNPCQITTGSLIGNNMLAAVVKGDTIAGTTRSIRVKRNLVISSRHRAHIKRLGSSFHVTLLRMSQASPSLTLKSIQLCLGGPLMSSRATVIGRVRAENACITTFPEWLTSHILYAKVSKHHRHRKDGMPLAEAEERESH